MTVYTYMNFEDMQFGSTHDWYSICHFTELMLQSFGFEYTVAHVLADGVTANLQHDGTDQMMIDIDDMVIGNLTHMAISDILSYQNILYHEGIRASLCSFNINIPYHTNVDVATTNQEQYDDPFEEL